MAKRSKKSTTTRARAVKSVRKGSRTRARTTAQVTSRRRTARAAKRVSTPVAVASEPMSPSEGIAAPSYDPSFITD